MRLQPEDKAWHPEVLTWQSGMIRWSNLNDAGLSIVGAIRRAQRYLKWVDRINNRVVARGLTLRLKNYMTKEEIPWELIQE